MLNILNGAAYRVIDVFYSKAREAYCPSRFIASQ